ncbi:hypothetical protein CASFOL_015738 [Castilleja foliolosa]|uniref:C2 NT-type domain-containing protein n=1 Tax=Castilleja foliolosa TaxID=1961234 RepID=A0ABD3DEI7_9LAMI
MLRVSKWKLDNTKVKVVFRLQFQATHVPQSGWDKLFISFIPADSGKASAKTTKANVRNGTCKWADPIYETTRLLQDSKTKQYDEKLYKIVVAMGSSRASTLGEATIDLVDYIDSLKPSTITLPLQGCNFGTILHVTIQLLTSKTGFREFEQQRELRESGIQSGADSHSPPAKIPFSEDAHANDQTDEVSSRVKYTTDVNDLCTLEEEVNLNEEYADSSNTSGSFYAEKQENEIDTLKITLSGDLHVLSHTQSPHTSKANPSDRQNTASSCSAELAMAFEENNRLKGSLELAESSLFDLKLEVSSLQTLADELGSETQRLSHKLSAEISSSEEFANEVSIMKSECLKFKDEIIKLKDLKLGPAQIPIAVVESKIRELQSKPYLDKFEALLGFLLEFKLGNDKIELIPYKVVSENGLGLDLCQPGNILQNFSNIPTISVDSMKEQMLDLVRELDESNVEKEGLTRKMNQMELYYEALIHELEESQKRLIGELQNSRNEHSTCLYTLSVSKSEMDLLRHDMNQQMLKFSELEVLNEELNRRASTSEAALRRARMNYSIAVDKLRKDLQVLSSQVVSMFETNENLIKQALPSKDDDAARLSKFRNQNSDILLEDLKRSLCLQEDHYQKVEKELIEMYSSNLNLDIYSSALQESLCEANADIRTKNEIMDELVEELKIYTDSQNELMIRLQKATDDVHTLNEYKSSSISQFSDMALQNQLLEDKLMTTCEETYLLAQKVKDLESYQSKYEACLAENEKVTNEMSLLKEKCTILKDESDELVSFKENINFVQDKLASLLVSYNTQFRHMGNFQSLDLSNIDVKDIILRLEEIQENVSVKYCEVMEENQNLKIERSIADVSLSTFRSEIGTMKQKFKSGLQHMVTKLDVSNALVDKLQAELESVANKLHLSSKIEENYVDLNKVLLADLALLEDQMQDLTCKNGQLAQEVPDLDALSQELEMNELTISKLMHDKQNLQSEISSLNETSKNLHDELKEEKAYKDELERKVRELTLHLNEESDKLLDLEKKKSDLELDKSRLARRVSRQNEFIEEIKRNNFEGQLLEMHDYSLAADVKLIYVANHYEALIQDLVQKLARSDLEASKVQKKLLSDSNAEKLTLQASEFERLENELSNSAISNEELEILVLVLKSKIHEQVTLLEEYKAQSDELSHKLSEQVLKTKEFKDLSTHLKEHKEKVESLRIAFIKEQCETQVQELKQQVSISKKHSEEMLLKLQDAIDEIENRKKSDAMSLKKNEELLLRFSALETELRLTLAEKREKSNAYDRAKAELECALLSLECCKEDKEKLRAEKFNLSDELNLVKGQLENFKCSANFGKDGRGSLPESEDKNLDVDNEHSVAQRLLSSMEHVHEELEKMKNENKIFSTSHDFDPSSFLKQHSDEEAVLKSFRDIHGLIKEMLELKERHAAQEAELREMHDRYSQLSLQFAEVEGERQKLKITLKNVRGSTRDLVA